MTEVTPQDVDRVILELHEEFPKFRTTYEKPWWLRAGFKLLSLITKEDYSFYIQTIGSTIYLPKNWNRKSLLSKLDILCHERIHMRQFKKYTLFGMAFIYLFVIFPFGLALGRARFEAEAYNESIRILVKYKGKSPTLKNKLKEQYINVLCGPSYGWAWPFKKQVDEWFEKNWEKV